MYLGAALKKHFADRDKTSELVVWGIELCPQIAKDGFENMNEAEVENAFRGYIAREEILTGVPLSPTDPHDADLQQPFDINVVFDGGSPGLSGATDETVWDALDRAAAQTTACLINGAGSGDYAEAVAQLRQGRRWNAYLLHVVSERSYGRTCRYLGYQETLPWHRDREYWDQAPLQERKDAFLHRVESDILPRLQDEPNETVKNEVMRLVERAEELRPISLRGGLFNKITGKTKEAEVKAEGLLNSAMQDDDNNYRESIENDPHNDRNIPKGDSFSFNLVLTEEQRRQAARLARDEGDYGSIGDILGAVGIADVRSRLTNSLKDVLKHPKCDAVRDDSDAFFEALLSIAVAADDGNLIRNEGLRPTSENLSYYIAADSRKINGRYGEWNHDLSKFAPGQGSADASLRPLRAALRWKPHGVEFDVPVEYSILTLAQVRQSEGFKDISSYNGLEQNYQNVARDTSNLRRYARYYGVKPPPELLPDADSVDAGAADVPVPAANPSVNGQPDHAGLTTDRA